MAHLKNSDDSEAGQAVTEYLLLLSILIVGIVALGKGLSKSQIGPKLITMISGEFKSSYQYGNSKAKGYDDGGPFWHPRASSQDGSKHNFRIFIVDKSSQKEDGAN